MHGSGGPQGWRLLNVSEGEAEITANGIAPLEVFREPGYGEWSFDIVSVELAAEQTPRIQSLGARGEFLITGLVDWEFPAGWPEEHDETIDGPKVPSLWSLTVAGIEFEVERQDAPHLVLARGMWLSLRVSHLTLWWGEDEAIPYYREIGSRRVIQRIVDHLRNSSCRSMWVSKECESPEIWVLRVRPSDFECAQKVVPSNIEEE